MPSLHRKQLPAIFALSLILCSSISHRSAADTPGGQEKLDAALRKLEKEITAVRGLAFKAPVAARVVPRPGGAKKEERARYSFADKAILVYEDSGTDLDRSVLAGLLMEALQAQHFDLKQAPPTDTDSDADLARAALVQGDAAYTVLELLKKDIPWLDVRDFTQAKAADLKGAFLRSQGARYVAALKERGGWEAVNSAYRFSPQSTASILHPEGVAVMDLGPGKVRGEFAIVQLLAEAPETAPLALRAAAGWCGDRVIERDGARAWVVAFTTPEAAQRFQSALAKWRPAREPAFRQVSAEPGANRWRGPKGEAAAVLLRGRRVLMLDAPDETAYRRLLERIEGPLDLVIYSAKDKRTISPGELTDRLLQADVVCIGETHDSDLHHRVQLQLIKALFAHDERLAVGMEMFQRPFQKEIDRYCKGDTTEDEFLRATEYRQRWGFAWSLYRPIVDFCRTNGVPVAALNAPRELTRRISSVGFDGLSAEEKEQLGPVDFQVKEHRAYWYDRLAAMHGQKDVPPERKERSYQVMTVWDEYMGASAARFQQARGVRRMVVLAGSGHIERGFGIPARTVKRSGGKAATVRVEIGTELDKVANDPAADYVVIVR